MQNFFSTIGFLVTACLFGAGFFIMLGRKDADRKVASGIETLSETMELPSNEGIAPLTDGYRESKGKKRKMESKGQVQDVREEQADLKSLYGNSDYVQRAAAAWKGRVKAASEEYSIRPDALLAHAIIQSYLGQNYGERSFARDLGAHAGDLVMPFEKAVKSYPNGWSIGYLCDKYDLMRHFPAKAEKKVAFAGAVTAPAAPKKMTAAPERRPEAKVAPREAGLREMVAKKYGYDSWAELCQKADRTQRLQAEAKVNSFKQAMTIR